MSELQATLEFSVELHKFYNVDLFQRGFYQIRSNFKSSPKVPSKVEVSLPRTKKSDLIFPPSIINGIAVSKTFQILYRNEEVLLDDVIHYRVHIVLDSAKIEETLRNAEFSLEVELWFSEDSVGMEQHSSIQSVSRRSLMINFVPTRGLHYHLPVLFDYFHLSCVSLTVHGALISIHQPYLPSPRSGNKRNKSRNSSPSLSTMESVLFGQAQLGVKYGTSRTRLAIACRIYQEVCTILLQALESLQLSLHHLSGLIPDLQRPNVRIVDCRRRMKKLIEVAQTLETEEDFLLKANSDISQLCAENILLWNKFLDAFTSREVIRRHLAQINHSHRIKRFAEGFFSMSNPRKSALCCLDAKHQHYTVVSEAVRRSQYFSQLPHLTVSCKELDGTSESLPIIFEDVYSDGVPKRNSVCDSVRVVEGSNCVLVSSNTNPATIAQPQLQPDQIRQNFRPSSVPLNLDITAVNNLQIDTEQASELANLSEESLDRLKRDLSILVEATMNATNEQEKDNRKAAKKKISLPIKLSDERQSSTLPSASEASSKGERKRSVDSSLNILSPSLSPDMKLYFKERLRSNWKNKSKSGDKQKQLENKFQKGQSGYSHLDCCSNIPYNLEEEPEVVDGMKNPKSKNEHEKSFTSQALEEDTKPIKSRDSPKTVRKPKEELEGMAKVRDIVLNSSKEKTEDESDSSMSEASGWVSNNSRRSSVSTTDTNSENKEARQVEPPVPEESRYPALPELKSPGLLLSKASRSRSEEPADKSPSLTGRPRHRSECGGPRSFSPVRKFSNSPIKSSSKQQRFHNKPPLPEQKSNALPPPVEFRDPPKDLKLDNAVRESNFAKVRQKKLTERKSNSFHHERGEERRDVKAESEMAIQRLYQAVTEISSDKKMSRSNTISFGDENFEDVKARDSGAEIRRKKLTSCENMLAQRAMSSSMQAIDRKVSEGRMFAPLSGLQQDYLAYTCCDWLPNKTVMNDEKMLAKIAYIFGIEMINFMEYREDFKRMTSFPGALYSDRPNLGHSYPYFTKVGDPLTIEAAKSTHLVVCVHGLDGNSADLRLIKTYLEMAMPSANLDFLMSEINQIDTFLSFEDMTNKLVSEIIYYMKNCETNVGKISFIGHSLGCILIRSTIQRSELVAFSGKFHTYLSLSGPHLGTMYNNSNLVNAGMWVMQRWKKSGSLQQLALKDSSDIRKTFMYKLSENSNLHLFKNVLLAGSSQDKYVPLHSARIELCKSAIKDNSVTGSAYKEMVNNILGKVVESDVELVRYDVHHALPNNTNSLIGRAAHIAVLDSELFIEKFLLIAVQKYFL